LVTERDDSAEFQRRTARSDPVREIDGEFAADDGMARGGAVWQTLEDLERQHIARTLAHTFYNRSAAARLLGVTRQALLRKIKRYGITASADTR
jgi:DNA-binding NtrC family response regulator